MTDESAPQQPRAAAGGAPGAPRVPARHHHPHHRDHHEHAAGDDSSGDSDEYTTGSSDSETDNENVPAGFFESEEWGVVQVADS